jgi:hypothetical protein
MSDSNKEVSTKILASTLLDENGERAEAVFTKGLVAIGQALQADRVVLGRDGDPVHLGPDHSTRLSGMRLLVDLCLGNRKPSHRPPPEREGWYRSDLKEAQEIEKQLNSDPVAARQFDLWQLQKKQAKSTKEKK